uniref:Golgi apparatus protein 1 n=1 Tax=Strigamia maritima TaxID=126957 RepID=T1J4W1_STRMM
MKLIDRVECAEDIRKLCGNSVRGNNFAILDCLQAERKPEDSGLSDQCSNVLWSFKQNLTSDNRFSEAAKGVCGNELTRVECNSQGQPPGYLLSCLIDLKDNLTDVQCKQFLTKMEGIVFSDYRLIFNFVFKCKADIAKFSCGRLNDEDDKKTHSQGVTIECLQTKALQLSPDCRHEILRISELQADDFHLDRPLYYACRNDREKFCSKISAGEGRIYKCLTRYKTDREMSIECQLKLTQRQKLIVQDYKVSKGLSKACRDDIKQYKCRENTSKVREIRLSQILICLESALHADQPVANDCQAEMLDHRRSVIEDFKISPDAVNACQNDIARLCSDKLEGNGKTIHCLMEHAKPTTRKKKRISQQCMKEIEKLVRESDMAEDWRVDPALKEACQTVVDATCKDIQPGEGRVLSCLMDKISSDHMTDECEERLLQMQYFVSRDFRLDTKLYRACRQNAIELCGASENWADETARYGPERGPLLPCLFRYAYHPNENMKLKSGCLQEVHRVMRQRAISVDLHPEIQEPCMEDLADYCAAQTGKGEELVCLQDHLENLSSDCQEAVNTYTEEEAEHAELNSVLYRACEPVAKIYCNDILKKDVDEGDLMQCLVYHKNDPDAKMHPKCKAAVDHFQLISLKNYRFSFKFKEACKQEVMTSCKAVRTKAEVVQCLSTMVKNDTLLDSPQRVGKECRHQLRVELLQRNEDFSLDPGLQEACQIERNKFCKNYAPGNAMVLECLKNHRRQLSAECFRKIFNREQEEMLDNSVDFALMTLCKRMIKEYCSDSDVTDVLSCLRDYKDKLKFDGRCRQIVIRRMVQQNTDYRLNPHLRKACSTEMTKYCKHILNSEPQNLAFEGKVIDCLKDHFYVNELNMECKRQVGVIIKESQMDVQQDAVLSDICKREIKDLCGGEDDGAGKVEECLKLKFQLNLLTTEQCRKQVAKLLQQTKADIHVDQLLFKACVLDLNDFCPKIPPGGGLQLLCLLDVLKSKPNQLRTDCRTKLSQRKEMFDIANQVVPVESMGELYAQVSISPARNYFLVVTFALIGMIFFGGLFCGRVTKRVRAETKNK